MPQYLNVGPTACDAAADGITRTRKQATVLYTRWYDSQLHACSDAHMFTIASSTDRQRFLIMFENCFRAPLSINCPVVAEDHFKSLQDTLITLCTLDVCFLLGMATCGVPAANARCDDSALSVPLVRRWRHTWVLARSPCTQHRKIGRMQKYTGGRCSAPAYIE